MADRRNYVSGLLFFAAFTALYYLSARVGLLFAVQDLGVSPVWPAAGLALAAVLVLGVREWPVILVLIFVANLLPGQFEDNPWRDWPISLGDAVVTTGEAMLAAWLVHRVAGPGDFLARAGSVFRFTGAVLIACMIGALAAAFWAGLIGRGQASDLDQLWFIFWVGDCAGMLLVAPLVLSWFWSPGRRLDQAQRAEFALALLTSALITLLVFRSSPDDVFLASTPFLIFPVLLWGAYRLHRRHAVTLVAASTAIAVWGTFNGRGPFADGSVTASLVLLQLYVCAIAIGFLALAAACSESRVARRSLAEQKEAIQVTLDSIGDGVITTDRAAQVEYMNPVATTLTGWEGAEAQGRPLEEVVNIYDEATRKPIENPVKRLLSGEPRAVEPVSSVMVDRHGREFHVEDTTAALHRGERDATGAVLVLRDVSKQRRLAREMAYHARHDALTGLLNRREFELRLQRTIEAARRYGTRHVVSYLDLDQFKVVNDTAGHAAGDEMLRQLKGAMADRLRERDTLARLGGDEFGLLLENCPLEKAMDVAQSLVDTVRTFRFTWQGAVFHIGVSIGLAPLTAETESVDQVLTQADVACFTAKELGRNQVHVYSAVDSESGQRHIEIQRATELRSALDQDRFKLFCQPIVPVNGGGEAEIHYEILIRMLSEEGEIIAPHHFIPAAERYGLAPEIDRWVIRSALHQHTELFGTRPEAQLAINLSGKSLTDERLLEFVLRELARSKVPPSSVCFEVTETATIQNLAQAQRFIQAIRGNGCQLALDDFGSGLSSFGYLKNLQVDFLKIDGSFVRHIAEDNVALGMVKAINDVGRIMAIKTIAEFTENAAILDRLRTLGVDYAQGFYIGKPSPVNELLA